jgi:hypothetical protein
MAYVTKSQLASAAKDIAELVELASFKDIGAAGLCGQALCHTLGIDPSSVLRLLSKELVIDPDFRLT